ncbi:MAG: YlxR family protein [Schumannella sp.]
MPAARSPPLTREGVVARRPGRGGCRGTTPGRGAWLHPDPGCVEQAIRRRAFGRALRATDLGTANLLADIIATQTSRKG